MNLLVLSLAVFTAQVSCNRLENLTTVDDFMNICLDSKLHKVEPGPEDQLFNLCTPWKDHSCCTTEIAQQLHVNSTWHKFSWDHCQPLSAKCRRHFQRDLCFYECSPNVGPWLVQEFRKWRNEKVHDAPLCESDCSDWYNDCKDDMTCVTNWSKDFDWVKGVQSCPAGSQCQKFSEVYDSATHFCEEVWDGSWKVVTDDRPCMKLWFDGDDQFNNAEVARKRAEDIVASSQHLVVGGTHGKSKGHVTNLSTELDVLAALFAIVFWG